MLPPRHSIYDVTVMSTFGSVTGNTRPVNHPTDRRCGSDRAAQDNRAPRRPPVPAATADATGRPSAVSSLPSSTRVIHTRSGGRDDHPQAPGRTRSRYRWRLPRRFGPRTRKLTLSTRVGRLGRSDVDRHRRSHNPGRTGPHSPTESEFCARRGRGYFIRLGLIVICDEHRPRPYDDHCVPGDHVALQNPERAVFRVTATHPSPRKKNDYLPAAFARMESDTPAVFVS